MNFWNPDLNEKLLQWKVTYNWCASSLNARSIAYTFGHVVWNRTWLKADEFFTHQIIYSEHMEALLHTKWVSFKERDKERSSENESSKRNIGRRIDLHLNMVQIHLNNIKYPFGLFRIFWFNEIIMDFHIDNSTYTRTASDLNASPFF